MHHEVTTHNLTGGAKLLAIHVPNAISCYFKTSVRAGFRFADANNYEVPHILEHLAFEGTRSYPDPLTFKSNIERLGAGYNAATSNNTVSYWFVAGAEHLEEVASLALSQVIEPLFLPERVEQQIKVIANELAGKVDNDQLNRGYNNYHRIFPYINPAWEERIRAIKSVTSKHINDFHTHAYGTKNLRFVVAGDISATKRSALINQLNNHLASAQEGQELAFHPFKPAPGWKRHTQLLRTSLPSVDHFYLRFGRPEYDRDSLPALRVLNVMYSVGMGSRMQMKARERGLTYTFGAGVGADYDMTSFVLVDKVLPQNLLRLFDLAIEELAEFKAGNFTDHELERAVGFMVGSTKRSIQTPADLASGYSSSFERDEPLESPQEFMAKIEAVDRRELARVANKYITAENWILTLVSKELEQNQKHYADIIDKYLA